jgi:hypothetical protein
LKYYWTLGLWSLFVLLAATCFVCSISDFFSMQVHLIEGIIDEVDSTVHVSWVQPGVHGIPQAKALRERLDAWVGKVHTTLLSVEAETPDLVAA